MTHSRSIDPNDLGPTRPRAIIIRQRLDGGTLSSLSCALARLIAINQRQLARVRGAEPSGQTSKHTNGSEIQLQGWPFSFMHARTRGATRHNLAAVASAALGLMGVCTRLAVCAFGVLILAFDLRQAFAEGNLR